MPTPAQSKSATVSSGNPSVTYASNLASGGKMTASIVVSNSSGGVEPVSAVSDGTNSFTKRSSVVLTGSVFVEIWDLDTPAGDVGTKPTITATISTNFGATILVQEVAGLATGTTNAAVLDGTPGQNHGTASPATTGASSSSAAGEYTVALYGDPGDGITVSLPSGYTADANNVNANSFATLFLAYKASSNGAESASFTLSGSAVDGWETILLTYKLAAAGGGSQALPPGGARRTAWRTPSLPPARRYRQMMPVPKQLNPPYVFTEIAQHREEWPRGLPRRSRVTIAVPAQVNPPFPVAELAQHRETWPKALPRRARSSPAVPDQLAAPFPVAELRHVRKGRGFMPRRGRTVSPVPAQQSAPANPAFVQQPARHLRLASAPRRGRVTAVPAGQHAVPVQRQSRRGFAEAVRRAARFVLTAAGVPGTSFTVGSLTANTAPLASVTASDAPLATLTADDTEA